MPRPARPDMGRVNPRLSSASREQLATLGRWLHPARTETAGRVIEEALDDLYASLATVRPLYASGLCPYCVEPLAPVELTMREGPRGVWWHMRCGRHLRGYHPDQPAAFYDSSAQSGQPGQQEAGSV